jgi:ribosomal protein S27AE
MVTDDMTVQVEFSMCPHCGRVSMFSDEEKGFSECVCCGYVQTGDFTNMPNGVVCLLPRGGFGGRDYRAPSLSDIEMYDKLQSEGNLDEGSYITTFVDGELLVLRGELPC